MKHLYLWYLNLRVWLAHRRLRKMGFRKIIDEADARTLLQLAKDDGDRRKGIPGWIKIAFQRRRDSNSGTGLPRQPRRPVGR